MSNTISQPQSETDVQYQIRTITLKLKDFEFATIIAAMRTLQIYRAAEGYHQELHRRAVMYQARKFSKRLFDISMIHRESYTLTLNPSEIEIVQEALFQYDSSNMIARLLYGTIHQKTI